MECIFSFICSSNNNIPRITGMLGKLRSTYGDPLLSVGEGGLAASGALGNIDVRFSKVDIGAGVEVELFFHSLQIQTQHDQCHVRMR